MLAAGQRLVIGLVVVFGTVVTGQDARPDDRWLALARASLSRWPASSGCPVFAPTSRCIRDRWGVPHIYAQNTDDLFMAQGYVMAQDRLWQMEMWRREREGRLAEILGPQAVARDRTARTAEVPRPDGRPRVDELSPRRQADLHRVCGRRERVHRRARGQPAGRVQAHRHHARAVDGRDAAAARGHVRRRVGGAAARAQRRAARRRGRRTASARPIRGTTSTCPTGSTSRRSTTR